MKIRWVDRSKLPATHCFMCDSKDGDFSFKHLEFSRLKTFLILGARKKVCGGCIKEYQRMVKDRKHVMNRHDEKYFEKIFGSI